MADLNLEGGEGAVGIREGRGWYDKTSKRLKDQNLN